MLSKLLALFATSSPRQAAAVANPRIEPVVLSPASGPERHAIANGRGLWGERTFPKSGWSFVGIQDLGEPNRVCEACGSARLRYVHLLTHPAYRGVLAAGCVCAGVLLGDEVTANARDAAMRSRAGKRARWLRRRWRRASRTGNAWLRADGYTVTIYSREDGWWGAVVSRDRDGAVRHLHRGRYTHDHAKLDAFDLISEWLSTEDRAASPKAPPPHRRQSTAHAGLPVVAPPPNTLLRTLEF